MDWKPDDDFSYGEGRAEPYSLLARVLNASLPLFPIGKLQVRLHWSFFIFVIIFAGWSARAGAGSYPVATLVLWALAQAAMLFLVLILLHELGHASVAILKGGSCSRIMLTPLGGLAYVEGMMVSPGMEAEVAIAGPVVNLLILGVSMAFVSLFGLPANWWMPFTLSGALGFLFWANVTLVVFNLIPAYPMDGGRILRAFLAWRRGEIRGTHVACRVGQVLGVVLVGVGVWRAWGGSFWGWMLIGIGVSNLMACSATLRMLAAGARVYEEYVPDRGAFRPSRRETRELRRQEKEAELERRMDELLDKVSREGMGSLTLGERLALRRASKHFRRKQGTRAERD